MFKHLFLAAITFSFGLSYAEETIPASKQFPTVMTISTSGVSADCSVVRQLVLAPSSVSYYGNESFVLPLTSNDLSRLAKACEDEASILKDARYAVIRAEINHGEYLIRGLAEEQATALRGLR